MKMISEIEDDVRRTEQYITRKSFNETVMQAMENIPRHEFVPKSALQPLPIGSSHKRQTLLILSTE